jgi:hypothetical protein
MRTSRIAGIGGAVVAAFLVGCAGGPSAPDARTEEARGPAAGFPTQEELEELAEAPFQGTVTDSDARDVERWELAGPFPDRLDERRFDDASPWEALLTDAAERRAGLVLLTEAMHCVAREIGGFYLEMGGVPSRNLKRYITARCQAGVESVGIRYLHTDIRPEMTDAQLFAQWREHFEAMIAEQLLGGPVTAGVWFGRTEDESIALVATGTRAVRLDPVETALGADHRVVVRGETLRPTEEIWAVMNHGRYRTTRCEPKPGVALPRFHFICNANPDDTSAWLILEVRPPGRLMGRIGANVLVWPSGEADDVYRRPSFGDAEPVENEETAAQGFVAMLNSVRESAELPELTLDIAQSETATALAPHFFAAWFDASAGAVADLVALGMIAGWEVDGIVQNAQMSASWAPQSDDLATLLATALEYPSSREVLLSPGADRIAIGPLLERSEENASIAAVFGTYSLFSEEDHDADVQRVLRQLREARRERGRRAPQIAVDVAHLSIVAASDVQAGAEPEESLGDLIQASAEILQRPVQGWVAQVSDLADLTFPEGFLTDPDISVAIGVSHFKPEGEAWGRYVVMMVVAAPKQQRV